MSLDPTAERNSLRGQVAVTAGGGSGIGSAISRDLARRGAHVVVLDPGVSVEGEALGELSAARTAAEIAADGGSATSSTVSVTSIDDLSSLFAEIRERYGSLDIVVNSAGILRDRSFPDTSENDWFSVLDVHFNGYLNVLRTALPIMTARGSGRILGFTSGVGLARSVGNALIYSAAKRAVAALTWQLGPVLPAGVAVNALSPIAATRMVRSTMIANNSGPVDLDLSAMPQPDDMAPAAHYLLSHGNDAMRGRVVFSGGAELTLICPPRVVEAVHTAAVEDIGRLLDTVMPAVLAPAEARQRSGGGSNPRFGDVFSPSGPRRSEPIANQTCLVVSDLRELTAECFAALSERGLRPVDAATVLPDRRPGGRLGADFGLTETAMGSVGAVDALLVALRVPSLGTDSDGPAWKRLLDAQTATVEHIQAHGAWLRAAARYGSSSGRALKVVLMTIAEPPGDPAAQAVAQVRGTR